MTMISESGAIRDISEIAAGLTAEEEARIESASLEELVQEIGDFVDQVNDQVEPPPHFELSPAMESLFSIVSSIKDAGSISRSEASAIMTLTSSMEGFENTFNSMPLSSFTELPSMVNYNASMESIVSTAWNAFVKVVQDIVKWIKANFRTVVMRLKGTEVKAKQAEVLGKKVSAEFTKGDHSSTTFSEVYVSELAMVTFRDPGNTKSFVSALERIVDACDEELNRYDSYSSYSDPSRNASIAKTMSAAITDICQSILRVPSKFIIKDASVIEDTHEAIRSLCAQARSSLVVKHQVTSIGGVDKLVQYIDTVSKSGFCNIGKLTSKRIAVAGKCEKTSSALRVNMDSYFDGNFGDRGLREAYHGSVDGCRTVLDVIDNVDNLYSIVAQTHVLMTKQLANKVINTKAA